MKSVKPVKIMDLSLPGFEIFPIKHRIKDWGQFQENSKLYIPNLTRKNSGTIGFMGIALLIFLLAASLYFTGTNTDLSFFTLLHSEVVFAAFMVIFFGVGAIMYLMKRLFFSKKNHFPFIEEDLSIEDSLGRLVLYNKGAISQNPEIFQEEINVIIEIVQT